MEYQEETSKSENFLLFSAISVLVVGAGILAAFLTSADSNIFKDVKIKWKHRKDNVPKEENAAASR